MFRITLLIGLALIAACLPARAAESYEGCAGTVASLPATIGASGVWCLKADLQTAMASGAAITISVNNVTIDCNGFRLGGLSAGPATQAIGIAGLNRSNVTVRNCNVRGFLRGLFLVGSGSGHVIENNRFDGNTRTGIEVGGDGFVVRRNIVTDTGGSTLFGDATGIEVLGSSGLLEENLVTAVLGNNAAFAVAFGVGIRVAADYTIVRRNDIAGVFSATDNDATGIASSGLKTKLIGNTVSALASPDGTRRGLDCAAGSGGIAIGTTVSDASSSLQAIVGCDNGGENAFH